MKKLLYILSLALLMACGSGNPTIENETEKVETKTPEMSKDELQTEIAKMEQDLSNKLRIKFDDVLAQQVVDLYVEYANNNPQDSITPEYLFKAGEVCIGLKQFDQSVIHFERIYKHFPKYSKYVESLYLVGFVYDEYMNNYGKAKEYYEKIVNDHADHSFEDDAQASIETLGLSDEEIIKRFEDKNKANS